MKVRTIQLAVITLLLLATLAFIWGNSLESIEASSMKSGSVLVRFGPLLEFFFGRGNVTDHLIRKTAHFIEFGMLGCELALLVGALGRLRIQWIVNALFAGLCVAVTDEALQLISGRGSLVVDVLLDFLGVITGIVLILLIHAVFRLFSRLKAITAGSRT